MLCAAPAPTSATPMAKPMRTLLIPASTVRSRALLLQFVIDRFHVLLGRIPEVVILVLIGELVRLRRVVHARPGLDGGLCRGEQVFRIARVFLEIVPRHHDA